MSNYSPDATIGNQAETYLGESLMNDPEIDSDEVLSYSPHTLEAMYHGNYDEFYAQSDVEFEGSDELDSSDDTE